VAINVLQVLDTAEKLRGAVILTYTLNLNFFEQLVKPRLDRMGCSNVVILVDRHGYDDALANQARSLSDVGTQYVCAPLLGSGAGVQHAKLILLVGPRGGRLLIGSGNLTFHGYGRNLELFCDLALDAEGQSPPPETLYPFTAVWGLLKRFQQNGDLSSAAEERLRVIQESAPWLSGAVQTPVDFQLWHNFEQSLYSRLEKQDPVDELQIIAPFINQDTIGALVDKLKPERLVVGVDALTPNLDGTALTARCQRWGCELELRALGGEGGARLLHAKALVGVGDQGAWCVTGSANCTPPALLKSWANGGNLELVVWQRSPDPHAFRGLWHDEQVIVTSREPASVCLSPGTSPDVDADEMPFPIRLLELRYEDGLLQGRFQRRVTLPASTDWSLELLRRRETLPITPDRAGSFVARLEKQLTGIEAARLVLVSDGAIMGYSPYHWIDQPAELARYGRRSYYRRVRDSLQTFDGAGKLFEELLNYLWERVDPRAIQKETEERHKAARRARRDRQPDDQNDKGSEPPPPPEKFIVTEEELSDAIGRRIKDYAPYDRSTLSLRDLLSLALLKLTVETEPAVADVGDADGRDQDADANREEEREAQRRGVLEQLRNYLLGYCRRYARRLVDPSFVRRVGPELLFQNHCTLCRVLLEFADKFEDHIFSRDHLRDCVVRIFCGLFWPQAMGLDGPGAWDILMASGYDATTLQRHWSESGLPPLIVALITKAWDEIPAWRRLLFDEGMTQTFMLGQALINHVEQRLVPGFWRELDDQSVNEQMLWGFRRAPDLTDDESQPYLLGDAVARFDRLALFRTPVEEKYADLFSWSNFRRQYQDHTPEAQELLSQVQRQGYVAELNLLKSRPPTTEICALEGDFEYCPRCYIGLPRRVLRNLTRGELALCPNCGQAVLYWKPKLNLQKW
jgi:hypothetical protein